MTVYVDDMRAGFGRMVMCHMIADSSAELFAMAARIGVGLRWVQDKGTPAEHFDIALTKRALALAHGAREITWRQCGLMIANRRATGTLGDPDTALDLFRQRVAARQAKLEEQRA